MKTKFFYPFIILGLLLPKIIFAQIDSLNEPITFDRFGNVPGLQDLIIPSDEHIIHHSHQCTAGFFKLTFKDRASGTGVGFDDPTLIGSDTLGQLRKNVVCQVFTDLSALFASTPDPVNIEIKSSAFNPITGVLASASPYYKTCTNTLAENNGIIDGFVWNAINSESNEPNTFDGFINVKFDNLSDFWYYDTSPTIPFDKYDLYTVLLHEALHLFDFGSLIGANGQSIFSAAGKDFYSRYDTYLETSTGVSLIDWDGCYNAIFNPAFQNPDSVITSSCSNIKFNSPSAGIQIPVFAPSTYKVGSSLSHLDNTCSSPFVDYVMHPAIGQGENKRIPTNEDVYVLLDIGYAITGNFGDTITGLPSGGINVAGLPDFEIMESCDTITITPLVNDKNAASFACLEPLDANGTIINNTGISFDFIPGGSGIMTFRYIPVEAGGKQGNYTCITIQVVNCGAMDGCSSPSNCNMICNFNVGNQNWTDEWFVSHGSPDYDTRINVPDSGAIQMWSMSSNQGEGIVIPINVVGGNNYIFSFYRRRRNHELGNTDYLSNVYVKLLDSGDSTMFPLTSFNTIPSTPILSQTILHEINLNVNNTVWEQIVVCFTANQDYDYLWIYPQQIGLPDWLHVDRIELIEYFHSAGTDDTIACGDITIGEPLCSVDSTIFEWRDITDTTVIGNTDQIIVNLNQTTTFELKRTLPLLPSTVVLPATNANCEAIDTVKITVTNPVTLTISTTDETSCSANNGTASVIPSGGISPYIYEWQIGDSILTDSSISGLSAGTYILTVNDSAGCTAIENITINEPTTLSLAAIKTDVSCSGGSDGSIDLTVSGGMPPYSYLWSTGDTTQDILNLPSGIYAVIVTDSDSCTPGLSVTINQPLPLNHSINSSTNFCEGLNGGEVTVNISGGVPPYTYLWSDTGLQTTPTATGLNAGTYNVTVTDTNGCIESDSVTINDSPVVSIKSSAYSPPCSGFFRGFAIVTVTGGIPPYSIQWDPNIPNTTPFVFPIFGTYQVTVTDVNGCAITDSVIINQSTAFSASIDSIKNVSCFGFNDGEATVTVSNGIPPFSYLWNTTPPQTSDTATGLTAGTYIVTITDVLGCSVTAIATINEPPSIADAGTDTTIFCGDSITFSAQPSDTTLLYVWSPSSGLNDTTLANPIAFPVFTTQYVLTVTDTTTSCIDSDTVIVTVIPQPIANAGPDTSICFGDTIVIGPQIVDTTLFYSWLPFTGLDDAEIPNPLAFPSITTQYILTVEDSATNCINFDTMLITVGNPVADAGTDIILCCGDSAVIGPKIVVDSFLYSWTPIIGLDDPDTANPNVSPPTCNPEDSNIYTLTVTDTITGCVNFDTLSVTAVPPPPANAGPDLFCTPGNIGVSPSVGLVYSWTPVIGLDDPNISNPFASPDAPTTYVLTVTDTTLGCQNTDAVFVHVINFDTTSFTATVSQTWTPANNPIAPGKDTIFIEDTLTIPAGIQITMLDLVFEFGLSGLIIIEPDATLTAFRTTFTGLDVPCETPWQGVNVQAEILPGDQILYGRLIMDSSSVVVHAQQGIFGQGIVEAQNSVFGDNDVSYNVTSIGNNGFNPSFFKNCTFESTQPLRSGSTAPHKFVVIGPAVSGVLFENDTFRNILSGFTGTQRPTSIQVVVAHNITINNNVFTDVNWGILSTGARNITLNNNTFTDVNRGIFSINSLSTIESRFIITNNIFTDVIVPIRIEGGRFDLITGNEFHGFVIDPAHRSVFFGIYLLNTSGFIIKANIFDVAQYAIFCINSGDLGGVISNDNTFTDCWRDIDARGDNPLLSIKCNVHTNNVASAWTIVNHRFQDGFGNWVTIPADMKDHQGLCFPNNPKNPAGNDFNNGNSHIFIITSARATGSFTYHSHTPNFSFPNVVPFNSSAGVTIDICHVIKNNNSCCPTFQLCPISIDIDFHEKVPFDTLPAAERRIMKEIRQAPNPAERQLKVNEL
ncbi:MAG: hypothetical protein FVQ77_14635, partial [Cytophagales bacterium]|nr:hypothetical protein [Cytophagales bacterium]